MLRLLPPATPSFCFCSATARLAGSPNSGTGTILIARALSGFGTITGAITRPGTLVALPVGGAMMITGPGLLSCRILQAGTDRLTAGITYTVLIPVDYFVLFLPALPRALLRLGDR
jgi:hypothetical protein